MIEIIPAIDIIDGNLLRTPAVYTRTASVTLRANRKSLSFNGKISFRKLISCISIIMTG